jgi:hypothetical protein
MPRLQGRFVSPQYAPSAAGRLREIEIQIREILRAYPDLANDRSNDYSTSRRPSMHPPGRVWRRRLPRLN